MFRYIKAMSYDKRKIENDLMNAAKPLTDHLIKLYLFPESQYENHWRKEVWNFLNRVPKMSTTKKFPHKKLIFDAISGYLDMTEELMYFVMGEYSAHVPQRTDADELEGILFDYFDWLSAVLASKGVVQSSEVYNKLDELEL